MSLYCLWSAVILSRKQVFGFLPLRRRSRWRQLVCYLLRDTPWRSLPVVDHLDRVLRWMVTVIGDLCNFAVEYIGSDVIGPLSDRLLIMADQSTDGIRDHRFQDIG